jgi:hypothetical protein
MIACKIANDELLAHLIKQGADINITNNEGLTALQDLMEDFVASEQNILMHNNDPSKITRIYQLLSQDDVTIKVEEQLFKLSPKTMEFFLYNYLVALSTYYSNYYDQNKACCFKANTITNTLSIIDSNILKVNRKKRDYISSILAKNEVNRIGDYNKKLFLRVAYGKYILNPSIEIKQGEDWCFLYKLLNFKTQNQLYA